MSLPRLSSRLAVLLFGVSSTVLSATTGHAAGPPALSGLTFEVSPTVVDVGSQVQFSLRALTWPAHASATVSFVSPHHGFSGKMRWVPTCNCFQVSVALARRIHALEQARATARLTIGKTVRSLGARFQIRGLAHNGRDFAPGGAVFLSGWVSDTQPVRQELEHYCAWTKTADGLGVTGYSVKFVAHFNGHTDTWTVKITNRNGVACSQRSIGNAQLGYKVTVDIYAAGQHVTASFTPHG
jgi:hypothetical protein